jgi:type IV pilus assembly protein PilW
MELMVSVTLGLMILSSLALLLANNSRALREMEQSGQQIENGRYATQYLARDLRLAGYYGEFDPEALVVPPVPDPSATNVASLSAALPVAVQGYHFGKDDASASTMPGGVAALLTDRREHSDVVVLRRASTCTAGPGAPSAVCDAMDISAHTYFQTSLCHLQRAVLPPASQFVIGTSPAVFTADNPAVPTVPTFLAQKDCATPALTRTFYVRIYYVANNSRPGDGVPTLKVLELGAGAFAGPSPVAEGVESIQLAYGVDLDTAGVPPVYTPDPANQAYRLNASDPAPVWPAGLAYPGAANAWHQVTTVQISVLARNVQASTGFIDTRLYVLGVAAAPDNTYGPYNDAYKRHVYTTLVRLLNVAGRRE